MTAPYFRGLPQPVLREDLILWGRSGDGSCLIC